MSNYIEYDGKIAFHPGYYIKELVEDSGLTQEEFAKRLDTTPKNLSILIRGEQKLSPEIAIKLSRMLGTSIGYWLNLQTAYDEAIANIESERMLEEERKILSVIGYSYFKDHFNLPDIPRKIDQQVEKVRRFLKVATLVVFEKKDMAVSFRSSKSNMTDENIIKANVMVEIATNMALEINTPKFDKEKFRSLLPEALALTTSEEDFITKLKGLFNKSGAKLIVLPNIPGSKTNGAVKKIGDSILILVNDRMRYIDTFWFTLMHEVGHALNGDYGISFEDEDGEKESKADLFAEDILIPNDEYNAFKCGGKFDVDSIMQFSEKINRDPSIIAGRLQHDGMINFSDRKVQSLRRKYML